MTMLIRTIMLAYFTTATIAMIVDLLKTDDETETEPQQ